MNKKGIRDKIEKISNKFGKNKGYVLKKHRISDTFSENRG